jgi:Domain of unknown function (DUF4410)
MKSRKRIGLCLIALAVVAGCASTQVTERQRLVYGKLRRPGNIWVYNFVATPAEVPPDSEVAIEAGQQSSQQTAEQIQLGRELGAEIAKQLVADIQGMGLPAQVATGQTSPNVNDILTRGYPVSIEQGRTVRRVVIGFGSGGSELETVVEAHQMTPQGLRKLGSGTIGSTGNKTPGAVVPGAVAIATGNPIGLIVVGGLKAMGEASGRSRVEGRAKATAQEIADQLKPRFQDQGWIL